MVMKEIKGLKNRYQGKYYATDDGRIWSETSKSFLIPSDNGYGYYQIYIGKKSYRVHRLIAMAFCEVPEGKDISKLDVGHLDDNPHNNRADNLKWMSRKENLDTEHFREATRHKTFSQVKCKETGEIYPSIAAAGRAIGIHPYGINMVLLGKQITAGGYHWERYYENEEEQ